MNLSRRTTALALVLTAGAGLALAGPLNPPAGPVTSTMKTLTEVEPRIPLTFAVAPGDNTTVFKITGSANYYLTGNVYVPPGYNGITVGTGGVTIDLNGFTIYGVQGSHEGVTTDGPWQYGNVILKNGRLTGLGTQAVNLSACYRSEVHNIRSEDNGGSGIQIGADSVATDCAAKGLSAFVVGDRCTVSRCTASAVGNGFTGTGKDVFENCTASDGTIGFSLGSDTTVRDCVVVHSSQQGVVFQSNCTITGNQFRACGIQAAAFNRVGAILQPNFNPQMISGTSGGGLGITDPFANLLIN
jgi:Right handed beta helix region